MLPAASAPDPMPATAATAATPSSPSGVGVAVAPSPSAPAELHGPAVTAAATTSEQLPRASHAAGGVGNVSSQLHSHIIGPFVYWQRHQWSALDWLCFYLLKYSFDALLVCVVLVCALQRDLVHAGYLALALLLFRKRAQLQHAAVQQHVSAAGSPAAMGASSAAAHGSSPVASSRAGAGVGTGSPAAGAGPSPAHPVTLQPSSVGTVGTTPQRSSTSGALTPPWQLQQQGRAGLLPGTPFWLLPVFNVVVLVCQVLYQAPFYTWLGSSWNNPCNAIMWGPAAAWGYTSSYLPAALPFSMHAAYTAHTGPSSMQVTPEFMDRNISSAHVAAWGAPSGAQGGPPVCTLPQLLGLCRLQAAASGQQHGPRGDAPGEQPAPSALWSLLSSEAVADVVLWLLLLLHARLLSSQLYKQVVLCVVQQQAAVRAAVQQRVRYHTEAQARAALAAGQQQALRGRRVAKLKALFCDHNGGQAWFDSQAGGARLAQILDDDTAQLDVTAGTSRSASPAGVPLSRAASPASTTYSYPETATAGYTHLTITPTTTVQHPVHAEGTSPPEPPPEAAQAEPATPTAGLLAGQPGPSAAPMAGLPEETDRAPWAGLLAGLTGRPAAPQPATHSPSSSLAVVSLMSEPVELPASSPAAALPAETTLGSAAAGGPSHHPADLPETSSAAGMQVPQGEPSQPAPQAMVAAPGSGEAAAHALEGVGLMRAGSATSAGRWSQGAATPACLRWLWAALRAQQYRRGRNMWLVCLTWLVFLISDYSLLALLPTVSLAMYALMTCRPAPGYWQALLVYAEAMLVVQYIYFSLTNCFCSSDSSGGSGGGGSGGSSSGGDPHVRSCSGWLYHPMVQHAMQVLGLHATSNACLPMFCSYLASLFYNYHLTHVAPGANPDSQAAAPKGVNHRQQQRAGSAPSRSRGHNRPSSLGTRLRAWADSVGQAVMQAGQQMAAAIGHLSHVYWRTLQPHEVPLHWLQLQLAWSSPAAAAAATSSPAGQQQLASQLAQLVMAGQVLRGRAPVKRPAASQAADAHHAAGHGTGGVTAAGAGASRGAGHAHTGSHEEVKAGPGAWKQWLHALRASSREPWPLPLSLRMEHCLLRHDGTTAVLLLEVTPTPPPAAQQQQQQQLQQQPQQLQEEGREEAQWPVQPVRPAATAAAALKAAAEEITRREREHQLPGRGPHHSPAQASPQQRGLPPSAARAPPPPHAAAASSAAGGAAQQQQQQGELGERGRHSGRLERGTSGPGTGGVGAGGATPVQLPATDFKVKSESIQAHSRQPRDLYAWSLAVDAASFLYAAVFYQAVTGGGSVGGLEELGNDTRTLPLGYLAALMALFALLVTERTVYSLGSCAAKLVLHTTSLALLLPWCMAAFWRLGATPAAHTHLRVFLLLRCIGWALSAQQLMWGYPPLSHRISLLFYRKPDSWNYYAYQVFQAVPLMYELRTLLDWTCTPTTLDLYNWLKFEDIRGSLYLAAAKRYMNPRRLGTTIPRYAKLLQGVVTLLGLLLVVWLPLLVFSQGAPTYTAPSILAVSMNMSITQMTAPGGGPGAGAPQAQATFPLYQAGYAFSLQSWGIDRSSGGGGIPALPPQLAGSYDPSQVQLMCMAPASQSSWALSPPARAALTALLNTFTSSPSSSRSLGTSSRSYAYGSSSGGKRTYGSGSGGGSRFVGAGAPVPPASWPVVSVSWSITRSAPLASPKGTAGPLCTAAFTLDLAGASREHLLQVLRGERESAVLQRLNASDAEAWLPGHGGPRGLWPLLWRARGETCGVRLGLADAGPGAPGAPGSAAGSDPYLTQMVSCSLGLRAPGNSSSDDDSGSSRWRSGVSGEAAWWEVACEVVDSQGVPLANASTPLPPQTTCAPELQGPQAVVVLERVQSGLLGATLSSFGITGLYITFVYGIARLLRLSISNLRLRIPTEDLPSCRRLVTLCQDIILARAAADFVLEEQLFRALINIYRSSAVLFELTQRKQKLS